MLKSYHHHHQQQQQQMGLSLAVINLDFLNELSIFAIHPVSQQHKELKSI